METELANYKELEDALLADGGVDKETLKALKVEAFKRMSSNGVSETAEPEVKDFFEVQYHL